MTFLDTGTVPPPPPDWDTLSDQPPAPDATARQDNAPDWDSLSAVAPDQKSEGTPPDWDSLSDTPPTRTDLPSSSLGSAVRSFAHGVGPAVAGAGLAIPDAAAGAELGALTSPVTGPVGPIVGGIAGALVGGAAGGGAGQSAEDWLLDKLGMKQGTGELSDTQEASDEAQHPIASDIGGAGAALVPFGVGAGANIAQRAVGATIMGGQEAGSELYKGEFSPSKIAIAALTGAVANQPRPWMERVTGPVINVGRPDTAAPNAAADKDVANQANDITTVAPGVAAENGPPPQNALQTAANAAEGSDRDYDKKNVTAPSDQGVNTDPIHPDLAAVLEANNDQAAPAANPSVAPAGAVPPVAAGGADTAQLPSGGGVPPISNGGPNPEGIPPVHTGIAEAGAANEAAQNAKIKNAAKIPANMDPVEASQLQRQRVADVQARNGGTADQIDVNHPSVQASVIRAGQRPMVETPMPSIANSSKDPNGPIYFDPALPPKFRPFVAIHETVEGDLEATGMPYPQAHGIATQAEKQAVEGAGWNWKSYSNEIGDHAKAIESQKINPNSLPKDLASNPEDDIGHHSAAEKLKYDGDAAPGQPGSSKPTKATLTAAKALRDAGLNEAADKLRTLPSDEADAASREYLARRQSKTGKATGETTRQGLPSKRPTVGEGEDAVTANSKGAAALKKAALDAVKSAFATFGSDQAQVIPTSTNDKAALIDRLSQAVAHAKDQFKFGPDPIKAYRPRVQPPAYQWVRDAQKLINKKNPTQADFQKFVTNENLLRGGGAKDVQATARVEGDIAHGNNEAGALATENAADTRTSPRTDIEKVPATQPGDTYVEQQHALADWVNGLDDTDWERVNEQFPMGIDHEAKEGTEPGEALKQAQAALEDSRRRGPLIRGNSKSTPVVTRADINKLAPTEPGAAASKGKSIKETDPAAFARLAEQYGNAPAPAPKAADRLEQEQSALSDNQNTLNSGLPIQGTWDALAKKAKEFGADQAGSIHTGIMDWITGKYHDMLDPKATPAEHEYASALDDRLHVLGQKHIRDDVYLRANALQAPDLTARQWQDGYRAAERGDIENIANPKLKQAMKENYQPVMDKLKEQYTAYRDERPELNLPEWIDEGYVPRVRKGTNMDPTTPDENDPLLGMRRHLSGDAPQFNERQFFTLEDSSGKRTVFSPDETGITTYVNGKSKHYDAPALSTKANDPNYVGKTFNAGKISATVKQAWANEINTHVDPKDLQFIENPILTASNAYKSVKTARDNWNMVNNIVSDPHFQQFATKDAAVAKEKGYVQIDLPDKAFRGMYAAPPIARVLNDYSSPGFRADDTGLWRQANQALTKLIFTTPIPHALNETQLWFTQRGLNWLPGNSNYGRLIRTSMRAMQSVNSQDYIQDQLAAAGASPMLGGVLTHANMQQIAQKMGLEVQKDAPKFDPIFKATGVSSKDVMDYWYRNVAQKPMWWWSDFLLTQQFLEHQEHGMSLTGAAKASHEFISDYRVPTTVMSGVVGDRVGRFMAQALGDPSVTMFGRYRYGLYRSVANMAMNLAGPNATKAERTQAVGNLLAMAALGGIIWPTINYGLRKITGNPDASLNPAGLMRELSTIYDAVGSTANKDVGDVARNLFQPAPLITTATNITGNKDWKGKPIVVRGQSTSIHGVGQAAEFAARQVAPYNTIANAEQVSRGHALPALGRIAAEQLGVKVPSAAERKYDAVIKKTNQQAEQQRLRHPAGPIESGFNYLSKKL